MVKYLVSQVSTNVNQRLKLIDMFGPDVECTVALIALYNQDAEMLRLLCKDLGAIVDEKIWIDGKPKMFIMTIEFRVDLRNYTNSLSI